MIWSPPQYLLDKLAKELKEAARLELLNFKYKDSSPCEQSSWSGVWLSNRKELIIKDRVFRDLWV